MGQITATAFVTLDGIMQGPGSADEDRSGGFARGGWVLPHFDEALGAAIGEIYLRAGAFLLGRGTWTSFASHWPTAPQEGDPVATALNALPKYVASRTRTAFDWQGSRHIADLSRDLPAIKAKTNGELQLHGSPGLLQSLLAIDAIDGFNLMIFPAVLGGEGKRMFGDGAGPANMRLISHTVTPAGVIVASYARDGALRTEDYVPPAA